MYIHIDGWTGRQHKNIMPSATAILIKVQRHKKTAKLQLLKPCTELEGWWFCLSSLFPFQISASELQINRQTNTTGDSYKESRFYYFLLASAC